MRQITTKRRRRINRTRNKKYGGWTWSGMFTNPTEPVKPVSASEKVGIEGLVGDREHLQNAIDNTYMGSTATAVASGVITTLAASGVGMPVAGLLAGALLIANKMFELSRSNLMLRLLMKDAIFIIMDCYLLYSLIDKSYEVIGDFVDPDNVCSRNSTEQNLNQSNASRVRKYQINKLMQSQLYYQIIKLINVLIHLMETGTLNMIMTDSTLTPNAFGKLLQDEAIKRKKEAGITGYFSASKIARNYDRKFGGSYYIGEINNVLTIVNSYIILLKSNLDMVLKKFEILDSGAYKKIWQSILCSSEYNSYTKPNTSDVIKEAQTDANEVGVNQLIASMSLVGKVDETDR